MWRYPGVALLVVCLLLLGFTVPASGTTDSAVADMQSQQTDWNPSTNTSMAVELQPSGDAVWTISTSITLETQQDVESFQSLAADFEAGELPAPGLDLFRSAVPNVDSRTDRSMELTGIERGSTPSSDLEPGGSARLYVEFTWANFGRVDGDRLQVDDVLVLTDDRLWLPSIEDGQTFIMNGPEGYGVQAEPGPDGTLEANTLRWEGPTSFEKSNLEATFIGSNAPDPPGNNGSDGDPNDSNNSTDDDVSEGGGIQLWMLAVPLLLLGLVVAAVAVRRAEVVFPPPADDQSAQSTDDGTTESEPPAAATTATADETEEEDDEIDVELLSDEERVERLLEQNGGRMKQATIVKETDWSDAKVSQLLSTMEDDGRIDKLRIGRENLISFPDENVTEIDE